MRTIFCGINFFQILKRKRGNLIFLIFYIFNFLYYTVQILYLIKFNLFECYSIVVTPPPPLFRRKTPEKPGKFWFWTGKVRKRGKLCWESGAVKKPYYWLNNIEKITKKRLISFHWGCPTFSERYSKDLKLSYFSIIFIC